MYESRRQTVYDLFLVLTIIFVTDFLMTDIFTWLYVPSILLWAVLPFIVELVLRKGTIRNLGFQKTRFKRSFLLYVALVACWYLIILGLVGLTTGIFASSLLYLINFTSIFFHPAFVEELNFRGFLETRLERLFSMKWSIVIQAVVFALYHVPAALPTSQLGFSPGGIFYPLLVFPFGLVLGLIYAKTRNLFVNMAIHGSLLEAFLAISVLAAPQ